MIPFANVDVALPVILRAVVCTAEVNVEVAPLLNVKAPFTPLIEREETVDVALYVEDAR